MHEICMKYAWDLYEICMRTAGDLHEIGNILQLGSIGVLVKNAGDIVRSKQKQLSLNFVPSSLDFIFVVHVSIHVTHNFTSKCVIYICLDYLHWDSTTHKIAADSRVKYLVSRYHTIHYSTDIHSLCQAPLHLQF